MVERDKWSKETQLVRTGGALLCQIQNPSQASHPSKSLLSFTQAK